MCSQTFLPNRSYKFQIFHYIFTCSVVAVISTYADLLLSPRHLRVNYRSATIIIDICIFFYIFLLLDLIKMFGNLIGKLLLLFTVICGAEALRILGLFPHPAVSHFQFFQPIMRQLAESGHSVDVVSPFPDAAPPPGYTDYALHSASMSNVLSFDVSGE